MLRITIVLVFCIVGLCSAATAKPKTNEKPKDVKEKRESAVSTGPYSYDSPQKSFQIPIHAQPQQQKAAQIEYHQVAQKVAPLEYYHQKQGPIQFQAQPQQHYEAAPQYHSPAGYPTGAESLFGAEESFKGFGEISYSYPGFDSFSQMPIVHYNPELNKINAAVIGISGYKSPSYSSYKTSPYQPSYQYASQSPSVQYASHAPSVQYASPSPSAQYASHAPSVQYSYPQAYTAPQQHQSYIQSYSHSAPSAPSSPYYGFSQSPSAIFVPQTVSIAPKPQKLPDYAQGLKGLGHYSTVSAIGGQHSASAQPAYIKQSYEVPSYHQYSQTERPFKASSFLSSGQNGYDSHSEQSIANAKPAGEYLPPSKTYLPAKEQYAPSKNYLPAKEQYAHYVPAKEQHYIPAKEHYVPAKEHYVPEQSPVEYQIQYISAPQKTYIPPVANNYLPPKSEAPKSSYLPPKSSYLPPSQPTPSYLPPNNPYQSSYKASSHSAPQQYQQQQYQQQDSYESVEYQSVTPSGHK